MIGVLHRPAGAGGCIAAGTATNIVESPFCGLRLRTDAARRYKKVEHATAVLWKLLLVAERRFRRLNSPELLKEVFAGVQYVDGVRAHSEEAAA